MLLLETNKLLEISEENGILWCEFAATYDETLLVQDYHTGNWPLGLCSIYDLQFTQLERYYK